MVVLLAICGRVALSPQRQSVYAADYATAARHWMRGQEIYTHHRQFFYSPLAAAALVLPAVLPDAPGGILWRLGCVGALVVVAYGWLRSPLAGLSASPPLAERSAARTSAFLLLLPLSAGNINLGQMNLIVLALTAAGVLAVWRRRWNTAALLLAASAFLKIYPLAVGLLLVLLYPRPLWWRLLLALAGLFLVSLGLQRPAYAWLEYRHWFATLGQDDRLDVQLAGSWRDFGFLVRACGISLSDRGYRIMEAAAGSLLALFLFLGQRRWRWPEARLLGAVWSLGCGWMLLFGPATEAATYVLIALPVCASLATMWKRPGAGPLPAIFAVSYALLLAATFANAWGRGYAHDLWLRALQPVATLLFAGGMLWWLGVADRPASDGDAQMNP